MMKKHMIVALVLAVVILIVAPLQVNAETILISDPLPIAAGGGFSCACVKLSKKSVTLHILIQSKGFLWVAGFSTLADSDEVAENRYLPWPLLEAGNCKITRLDGKSVTTKQFRCTFSTLDAFGNPTAVVPVDIKHKR